MQLFEEAFMPTLRTILNAPSTSPLSGVDVNNVAMFLIEMTHVHRIVSTPPNRSALTKVIDDRLPVIWLVIMLAVVFFVVECFIR